MSSRLAAIARETVEIVDRGSYIAPSGADVRIVEQVAAAVSGTRLHLPDEPLPPPAGAAAPPRVTVTNETSLDAARRLGGDLACLNFASAKNAGGGFLRGARAQEEDLTRASALYHALRSAAEFYAFHRAQHDLRYSDRIIYSPGVPVFRDDRGALLEQPYPLSFLTVAAPNAAAIRTSTPELIDTVPAAVRSRAARVLDVAAVHGHRRLILGAWGCGVFGNDPALVADAFAGALADRPYFDEVAFAVLDRQPGTPTHAAFAARFS